MKYFRKTESEYGSYVDEQGTRYVVDWCSAIYSPKNETPEQLGYEPFKTQDDALSAWGLTPYIDPEEELLTEE